MDQGPAATNDPYARLGIAHDAPFDAVQAARDERLAACGDDPIARSRVEAAYEAVLMDRLKERQQGRVSSAARTASQREVGSPAPRPSLPALPRLPLPSSGGSPSGRPRLPRLALAQGRELWFPLATHGFLLLLLVLGAGVAPEFLLALGTGATVLNLQRRHGRFLAAVLWGFGLLAAGLLLGAVLLGGLNQALPLGLPLTAAQVQSLPVILLLLLGAVLLA
ncbi:MAG: CPP1-like family protein [Prochlorococcaceae cyanobacterium]